MAVSPTSQGLGIGRQLLDWGKKTAREEGLPLYLESSLEAVGFYERNGFRRLGEDCVVLYEEGEGREVRLPVFVWEGEEGKWLERDGKRWRWRAEVLPS